MNKKIIISTVFALSLLASTVDTSTAAFFSRFARTACGRVGALAKSAGQSALSRTTSFGSGVLNRFAPTVTTIKDFPEQAKTAVVNSPVRTAGITALTAVSAMFPALTFTTGLIAAGLTSAFGPFAYFGTLKFQEFLNSMKTRKALTIAPTTTQRNQTVVCEGREVYPFRIRGRFKQN